MGGRYRWFLESCTVPLSGYYTTQTISKKQTTIDSPHTSGPLIVGAGLAGCLLAWRFDQAGLPFQLIGSSQLPNAWSVAAGVINPVTGRWITKSWNIDRLLPEALHTYRQIEQTLGIRVYHPVPLFRYCQNADDAKRCARRMRNPRYHDLLGPFISAGSGPEPILDRHGSFEIRHAAYVDLPLLIPSLLRYFAQKKQFRDERFAHSELSQHARGWHYRGMHPDRVIFCEGVGLLQNPWFRSLPLTPAKGETLILSSRTLLLPKTIYHHKKWILPYGDQSFRIGATYDEADASPEPTAQGRAELFDAARACLAPQYDLSIQAHLAGIRPCSRDSRPLLGQHPAHPGLWLLNGLGSKGASLAPEMTRILLGTLRHNTPLDSEIDLARCL